MERKERRGALNVHKNRIEIIIGLDDVYALLSICCVHDSVACHLEALRQNRSVEIVIL